MLIRPNSDFLQRRPYAETLRRAGLLRMFNCLGRVVLRIIVTGIADSGWLVQFHFEVGRQIFKTVFELIGLIEQGRQGVGELTDGTAFVVAALDFLHDVAGGFEHVFEQFEFEVGEVAVLSVFVNASEFVLVDAPAF